MAVETTESTKIPKYPPNLKARGKQLWDELHRSADFTDCPETQMVVEEACYIADEINRLRRLVRGAGDDTRVLGSQKQPVSMPEIADLQRNQQILLGMLKSLRLPDDGDGVLTRSQVGRLGALARWDRY
ncbi:MAG: hypothetical protein ACPGVG_02040 [Mycobacterium sp.]